jgi:hypothetical protein
MNWQFLDDAAGQCLSGGVIQVKSDVFVCPPYKRGRAWVGNNKTDR